MVGWQAHRSGGFTVHETVDDDAYFTYSGGGTFSIDESGALLAYPFRKRVYGLLSWESEIVYPTEEVMALG